MSDKNKDNVVTCENCVFFRDNWRCVTWHSFVKPDGFCYRAEKGKYVVGKDK